MYNKSLLLLVLLFCKTFATGDTLRPLFAIVEMSGGDDGDLPECGKKSCVKIDVDFDVLNKDDHIMMGQTPFEKKEETQGGGYAKIFALRVS
jgi:hypothetical protein